jgi:peptidylprolyl isomerase
MNLRTLSAAALAVLALGAAACGGDDETTAATTDTPAATQPAGAPEAPEATAGDGGEGISDDLDAKPEIPRPSGEPPTALEVDDVVEGDGETAEAGATITVQYVGAAFSTGEEFDASWDRGEPFAFPLGGGRVIPGWDQGLEGMKVGGRRVLTIPPELAYGPAGFPPAIGPNETLVFVVDLVDVAA